jgi:hypothetical protein
MLINELFIISNIFMYLYSNETLSAILSTQYVKRYVPLLFANSYLYLKIRCITKIATNLISLTKE